MDLKLVMAVRGRFFFFFFNVESEKELWIFEMRKRKYQMARESIGAQIPCGKPKSSGNIKWRKRLREMGAMVFM